MEGPLGIAVGVILVVVVCIQLAIALRNRYIKAYPDAEKDVENFATELELQLQGELDDAIKSLTPFPASVSEPSDKSSSTYATTHVTFVDEDVEESSWSAFKRESKAKLGQLATTFRVLPRDETEEEDGTSDTDPATPTGYSQTSPAETHYQRSIRRQLPLLDSEGALAERAILVNAKQYTRILKRRLARKLIEDYFRAHPKQKSAAFPAHNGSMRRPRGPGGRFLTTDEIRQMESGPLVNGVAG
jgi:hypothetical protein